MAHRNARLVANMAVPDKKWTLFECELLEYCGDFRASREKLKNQSEKEDGDNAAVVCMSEDEMVKHRKKRNQRRRGTEESDPDSEDGGVGLSLPCTKHLKLNNLEARTESVVSKGSESSAEDDAEMSQAYTLSQDMFEDVHLFDDMDGIGELKEVESPVGPGDDGANITIVGEETAVGDKGLKTTPRKRQNKCSPQKLPAGSGDGKIVNVTNVSKETDDSDAGLKTTPRKRQNERNECSPQKLPPGSGKSPRKAASPVKATPTDAQETLGPDAVRSGTPKKTVGTSADKLKSPPSKNIKNGGHVSTPTPHKRLQPPAQISPARKRYTSPSDRSPADSSPMKVGRKSKWVRQSSMSNFVTSVSEKEMSELDREIQRHSENMSEESPFSRGGSTSPALSDEGFKTPREKSAYRALNFSSPASSSHGFAVMMKTIDEVRRNTADIKEKMSRILSCVLPPVESNICEDIPCLPMTTKEQERHMNELLGSPDQFNKVVSFLYGLGGISSRDAAYSAMKSLFTDEYASTKSMKGTKRVGKEPKTAFMGTLLCKAVICAVRRRFRDTTVSDVIEVTANWLKDAPSREKKRQRRKEARESLHREYEEDEVST